MLKQCRLRIWIIEFKAFYTKITDDEDRQNKFNCYIRQFLRKTTLKGHNEKCFETFSTFDIFLTNYRPNVNGAGEIKAEQDIASLRETKTKWRFRPKYT